MDDKKTEETAARAVASTKDEKKTAAPSDLPTSKNEASGRAPKGYRWGDEYCR